jgi:glucose-1-phosphate cytidylyltransferase
MKVAILAGGLGTRLQEKTADVPKPMVEIGGQPMLWHIMKLYEHFGFREFAIALGYKREVVSQYFLDYRTRSRLLTVALRDDRVEHRAPADEDWVVHLLDTGAHTQTGGRVKRLAEFIGPETFLLTYGDGVASIDLRALLAFHRHHGRLATLTAVHPPARFGHLTLADDRVTRFGEKPQLAEGWINGGFFVLEPAVVRYLAGDETVFEREPLERLAADGQLMAYRHDGFWWCMDTLRDVRHLQSLWEAGDAPWAHWTRPRPAPRVQWRRAAAAVPAQA